jgi:2-methylisocitrate lyase-like PEP mutase family enzyme
MPSCFDALSARLIRQAGFQVSLMSGFAVSGARFGLPDTGLVSITEMLDSLRAITDAEPDLLLVGDGDTGYGNAMNVQRTVQSYARAGAAAVMIEDQVFPKRCGHTAGKQVISRQEARLKIRAAVDAAHSGPTETLILARTDARAVHGFDEALERCHAFAAEGADIIFLEAPESEAELKAFCDAIPQPKMANLVRGGKTPMLPQDRLQALGFKLVCYPLTGFSAAITAQRHALALIAQDREATVDHLPFSELTELVGFPTYTQQADRFALPADPAARPSEPQ